ncbi:MAG: hypothetical protein JWO06_1576 [Bacteroidota bacterium]|nr:hypothetical protein [Bacteroidota bacterium]
MMKKCGFIFSFLVMELAAIAQLQPYNKAYIWRGFQHQWTYNHRCNRLGDYVQFNSGTPISVHTSGTGSGSDSTYYTSFYTYVATPDVVFKEGEASIKIKAKENHLVVMEDTVYVPAEDWLKGKSDYVTLINGFDLRSDRAADKIQLLRFSLEDGGYNPKTNKVWFIVSVSLVLNCQSLECNELNNRVDYDLDLHYLVVGLNKGQAAATDQLFTRGYTWDKKGEISSSPKDKSISGDATPFFPEATVGIKSFSYILNEAHWLLEISNKLTPGIYDARWGTMKVSIDLLFKEWQDGMRGSGVAPLESIFAKRRKGWAIMDMNTVLLQFKKAKIKYQENTGKMYWKATHGSADTDRAKEIYDIPYE